MHRSLSCSRAVPEYHGSLSCIDRYHVLVHRSLSCSRAVCGSSHSTIPSHTIHPDTLLGFSASSSSSCLPQKIKVSNPLPQRFQHWVPLSVPSPQMKGMLNGLLLNGRPKPGVRQLRGNYPIQRIDPIITLTQVRQIRSISAVQAQSTQTGRDADFTTSNDFGRATIDTNRDKEFIAKFDKPMFYTETERNRMTEALGEERTEQIDVATRKILASTNPMQATSSTSSLESRKIDKSDDDSNKVDLKSMLTDPGQQITVLGAVSNLFLCGIKGAAGAVGHSPALIADAVHSLSDLMSDAVTLAAIRMTKKKPDTKYPFGYGKFEQIGSLGVSGMICITACGIGWESVQAIISPVWEGVQPEIAPLCVSVCFISVAIKEMLYRQTLQIGKKTQSCVLIANAWHHRSDAWSSIVAALGVAGSFVGVPMLDPAAGCVVALGVFKVGVEMGYASIVELADRHDDSIEKEVLKATEGFDLHVSRVRVRKAGPRAFVHLHIVIHPRLSVASAEFAAAKLKETIIQRVPDVEEVWIKWSCDSPSIVRRVADLQSEIRGIVSTVPNVLLCTHVHCHFLSPKSEMGPGEILNSQSILHSGSISSTTATNLQDEKAGVNPPEVIAEVGIVSSLRSISDLRDQTNAVRALVLDSMKRSASCNCDCVNVVEVDVKVDLKDGCQFIQVPDLTQTNYRACSLLQDGEIQNVNHIK